MAKDILDAKRQTYYTILPELLEPDLNNGRAYEYTREDCADLIADFADPSIGQLQAVDAMKIKGSNPERYRTVFGSRRRAAMIFYNEDRAAQGLPPMVLKFAVLSDLTEREAHRINVRENAGRKSLTPIDVAKIIRVERQQYGATDAEIAALFPNPKKPGQSMSIAFVTQHAKLNSLPEDIRLRVHRGDIGADIAFKLADMSEEDLRRTLDAAAEVEAGIELASPEQPTFPEDEHPTDEPLREAPAPAPATPEQTEKAANLKKEGKLKGSSIDKAMRNVAPEKAGSRKMTQVNSYLDMVVDSETSAGFKPPMVDLLKGLRKFTANKLTERQMTNLFEKCCKVKY